MPPSISPATLARIRSTFAVDPEAGVYALAWRLHAADYPYKVFGCLTPAEQAPWLAKAGQVLGGAG